MSYFELSELLASEKALSKRISNLPTWEIVEHLNELREKILDPLRVAWGSPINVTSGFRGKKLNAEVGGSATSAHMCGYAVDLVPANGKIELFIAFAIDWAKTNNIGFDQIIDEKDKRGNHWCHIGLYNSANEQRRETKKMLKA